METKSKIESTYKTIGQVAKELNLIDKKTGQLQTYTIRYWETQFRQIRPSIRAGGRRYYSAKDRKIINYIKFLLREKGLTISGVKKILSGKEIHSIDEVANLGVYKRDFKTTKLIKDKLKNIAKIIRELKNLKNG